MGWSTGAEEGWGRGITEEEVAASDGNTSSTDRKDPFSCIHSCAGTFVFVGTLTFVCHFSSLFLFLNI